MSMNTRVLRIEEIPTEWLALMRNSNMSYVRDGINRVRKRRNIPDAPEFLPLYLLAEMEKSNSDGYNSGGSGQRAYAPK